MNSFGARPVAATMTSFSTATEDVLRRVLRFEEPARMPAHRVVDRREAIVVERFELRTARDEGLDGAVPTERSRGMQRRQALFVLRIDVAARRLQQLQAFDRLRISLIAAPSRVEAVADTRRCHQRRDAI